MLTCDQENDGQNLPSLFKNASNLLAELSSQTLTDEGPSESLDFSADLVTKMEQLSQITQAELSRELLHIEYYILEESNLRIKQTSRKNSRLPSP